MTTACSLRDLVISGLITDDLCAALSSLAAEARLFAKKTDCVFAQLMKTRARQFVGMFFRI